MNAQTKPPRKLLKILVPTDFGVRCDAAIDYASFLAERFDAQIEVLYVWTPSRERRHDAPNTFFADSSAGIAMERCLSRERVGTKAIRGQIEFGELSSTIVRVARSGDFDLIVMTLHERSATSDFEEEVARKVARQVDCPTLMLRSPVETSPSAAAIWEQPVGAAANETDDVVLARWIDDGGGGRHLSSFSTLTNNYS